MKSDEWYIYKLKLSTMSKEDQDLVIDEITWKQFIIQALGKTHGLFGQGVEQKILNTKKILISDDYINIAYVLVSKIDDKVFGNAVNSYINYTLIEDKPLMCSVLQKTDEFEKLEVNEEETLWKKKLLEQLEQ